MGLSKNGKRMGRPVTDNPKQYSICARIDAQTRAVLDLYCEKHGVSISEAVSTAINALGKRSGNTLK